MINDTFIEELASARPTPGGGAACACCGALAAALAQMVGNLALGKKLYADVQPELEKSIGRLAKVRERLMHLADLDAKAYSLVSRAFRMPADTPEQIAEKDLAMQSALVQASDVPLDIMHSCMDVLREAELMAESGPRSAVADAGCSAAFAKAALQGASLSVYANADAMTDVSMVMHYRSEADRLFAEGSELGDKVLETVMRLIGGTGTAIDAIGVAGLGRNLQGVEDRDISADLVESS